MDLTERVRLALGASAFSDETIAIWISEVKSFMLDAGVPQSVVDSEKSIGLIVRGVTDLWNLDSGNAKLSEYFKMRVGQLRS
ncbi:MAG: hypothetical protein FWG90_03660 [Oscillospiraceae bacterium]|nr:hypothetical protein [Oscillospiraceae bacterium]